MNRGIYVVWDNVALAIVGMLMMFVHDAAAVREFTEALSNPESLGRRPQDYELVCVGVLSEEGGPHLLEGSASRPVLTGAQWLLSRGEGPKLAQEG